MDAGTHARQQQQDEPERALDSSRLRSSARLGFNAPAISSAISSPTAAAAGSCRVARRKRKTRRRRQRQQKHRQPQQPTQQPTQQPAQQSTQRSPTTDRQQERTSDSPEHPTGDDDRNINNNNEHGDDEADGDVEDEHNRDNGVPERAVTCAATTAAADQPPQSTPSEILPETTETSDGKLSDDTQVTVPTGASTRASKANDSANTANTTDTSDTITGTASGSSAKTGQDESEKSRGGLAEIVETEGRRGGSGSRAAAASSLETDDNTLLNRRAAKRPSRRCNSAARRNAMTMDLQRLISEVHARPAIWDQKNVNYHNRDVILKMWREIARACEVSTDVAKSKWKHLRDNFRNELKKTYRGKGEGGGEHDSKWVWFRSLFFLRDQMNSRVIGCSLSQNCSAVLRSSPEETQIEPQIDILEGQLHYEGEAHYEDLDGDSCQSFLSNDDGLHHVMPPPKFNRIGRKRTFMDAMMGDYSDPDRKRYEALQKRLAVVPEEEDDTYHFLMSVRNPLRSLPLDRQMFVRLKIQELVYNEINSQNQQNRGCDVLQDVKPIRVGNICPCPGTAAAVENRLDGVVAITSGTEIVAASTLPGNGQGATQTTAGPEVSDMSNPASLLQNCTSEGSSDGVSFD